MRYYQDWKYNQRLGRNWIDKIKIKEMEKDVAQIRALNGHYEQLVYQTVWGILVRL